MGFKVVDINGADQVGTTLTQSFIDSRGVRSSTSNAYIDPNPFPDNMHIATRALVTKILFNRNNAVGVEFFKNGKVFTVKAMKEVIVSGGNLE